ncbi:LysM domain-containing protein [Rhizobium sp. ERR 922]|uniref:LysM peptidoglycan-binding domain-containing protein n=1 Tax=unclassified Rhizobium TaxID=2613769 RepID=UPI0011A9D551|nr:MULTISPECIES: LysM peptidoglycan-binding domain-containing protein [unclassified Rhizobium]TWB45564.1 LysM domain-containing protein [Rhizobium sp. ERR 922]TWB88201.1 LysM domain-containing protein [Rhizobium sp. ERR 942]
MTTKLLSIFPLLTIPFWPNHVLANEDKVNCHSQPSIYADMPFVNPAAIVSFQNYIARLSLQYGQPMEIPPDFLNVAPTIKKWGYRLREDKSGICIVDFVQVFDVTAVMIRLRDEINRFKQDGCSYFSASGASLAWHGKLITFSAALDGKQRACGDWPWGGGWTTDIGDISGNVSGTFSFRTERTAEPGRYNGRLLANDPTVQWNVDLQSIFGIDTGTLVGKLLVGVARLINSPIMIAVNPTAAPFWASLNQFDDRYRFSGNSIIAANYLLQDDGKVSSKKYTDFMQVVRKFAWSIQPSFFLNDDLTNFDDDGSSSLDVVFSAQLKPSWSPDTIWADANTEIKLINSFSEQRQMHTVAKGETLWKIATAAYGNGFYYNLLDVDQKNKIEPGQTISLPPLNQMAPVPDKYIVSPGDTATQLCSAWLPGQALKCIEEFKQANPGIELNRLYVLQRLNYPPSAAARFTLQ